MNKQDINTFLVLPNLDINSFIRDMPGFAIIKDLQSNYLNANLNTIHEFGLKSSDNLYGYSDLTIPHPLSQNGQVYRNLDLEVITTGEPMRGICTFPFQGSIRPYRFRKSILKDINGNSIATYSHAEECNDPVLIQFIQNLIENDPVKFNRKNMSNSFILNKEYRGITLSPSESNCLFYLIRRKTKSDIAKLLNLPVKIISVYIETIKNQLNVAHIRDILDISIIKGFVNIVPPGIFTNHFQAINREAMNVPVKLTRREFDCAKLLITGRRIKEIAEIIHLSPRTIETHINNLKMKFDCRDKVELIIKLRHMNEFDKKTPIERSRA